MAGEVHFDSKEWQSMIRTIEKKVKDPRPMLKAAFNTRGFKDIISHFTNETGPDGGWVPHAPATAKRRGPNAKLLQDTGNLRRNFTPSNIKNKDRNSILFFNPTPYGGIHDRGSKERNVPQREFMWLSDEAQEDMLKIILDLVVKE